MKKATKKKTAKKVAKKKVTKFKTPKLKFDFAEVIKTSKWGGKGKIYIKLLGPEVWGSNSGPMKKQDIDIDHAQFLKPNAGGKACLGPGECWAEFEFTKICYAVTPEDPADFESSNDDNYLQPLT